MLEISGACCADAGRLKGGCSQDWLPHEKVQASAAQTGRPHTTMVYPTGAGAMLCWKWLKSRGLLRRRADHEKRWSTLRVLVPRRLLR
jgi:hypothetical protein